MALRRVARERKAGAAGNYKHKRDAAESGMGSQSLGMQRLAGRKQIPAAPTRAKSSD